MKMVFNKWAGKEIAEKYNDDPNLFAREVCQMHPSIEIENTGGGCDALVKRLADGGWLVYTTDSQVPIAPNDDEMVTLVRYPYDREGWGNSEGDWDQLCDVTTVQEAIEYMAAAEAHPQNSHRYQCTWGDAYPANAMFDYGIREIHDFGDDNGYDAEDRAAISALEIGRTYTVDSGMAGEHVSIARKS
jgi:hypothetical protein